MIIVGFIYQSYYIDVSVFCSLCLLLPTVWPSKILLETYSKESEEPGLASPCSVLEDCAQQCPQDVGCICKKGRCKISGQAELNGILH